MGLDRNDPHVTNSSIFVFNKARKVFVKYQDIVTYRLFTQTLFRIN